MSETTAHAIGSIQPGHYGAEGSGVFLAEAPIGTAWNVHGDATSSPLASEVERIAGVAPPAAANTARAGQGGAALWLGPASWLLITRKAATSDEFIRARDAINAAGGALFDVSASRIAYVVDGPRAPDVLAAGCPLDFHPREFGEDVCRQSLYGRVPALFYRRGGPPAWVVMVARSFGRDTWRSLCAAAAPHGYTVRAEKPFV